MILSNSLRFVCNKELSVILAGRCGDDEVDNDDNDDDDDGGDDEMMVG